jgi:hypothetical protein
MKEIRTAERATQLLDALGEQLESADAPYELVIVGGSALLALGLITRPTKDVDVVALRSGLSLQSANPLPKPLLVARSSGPGLPDVDGLAQRRSSFAVDLWASGRVPLACEP